MCAFSRGGEGEGVKGQGSVIEFISKQTNELRAEQQQQRQKESKEREEEGRQRFQASDKRSSVQ